MVGSKDIEIKGEYNPDNYTNLHVSSEIKDLFKYIGR
jgi:hypothetical protein